MARVSDVQARKHALFHLYTKTRSVGQYAGLSTDLDLSLGDSADFWDIVHLQSEDPPLRCFEVTSGSRVVGNVCVAGTTALGSTFVSARFVSSAGFRDRFEELETSIAQMLGSPLPELGLSATPIVYSYPKFGLGVELPDASWIVCDYYNGEPFVAQLAADVDDAVQGRSAWSFWDTFPQAGGAEEAWKAEDSFVNELLATTETGPLFSADSALTDKEATLSLASSIARRPPIQLVEILPVPIEGQVTNVHCAPASLSMMYAYVYGTDVSQEEAGEAMHLLPNGSTISGQLRGFREKFGEHFDVTLDRSPTWDELRVAIRSGLPAKSGIRGHARVAVGVRQDIYQDPLTGEAHHSEELLLVNDPEPVGSGSQVWENARTSLLRDFIFLTRK